MKLFVFGVGYSSQAFIRAVKSQFTYIAGTVRSQQKADLIAQLGVTARVFDHNIASAKIEDDLAAADVCLVSIPPDVSGDPVLNVFSQALASAPNLKWIGYLSTVGVYGDHQGAWVDENTPMRPTSERSIARLKVENEWLNFARDTEKTVDIFRLSGIYGLDKNALINLQNGTARRIIKPSQVFNRIHVDDIAHALKTAFSYALKHPKQGDPYASIYNLTDDEPAPPQDVVSYAAQLMGLPIPPDIAFENAALSEMGRSFYSENKRVSNKRIKDVFGYTFIYPNYREALNAAYQKLKD